MMIISNKIDFLVLFLFKCNHEEEEENQKKKRE